MKYKFADLIDGEKFKAMMDNYCRMAGVASAIVDLEGKVTVDSSWKKICRDFHRLHPETCKRCVDSDTILVNRLLEGKNYAIYRCQNGLECGAASIVVDGEHVANLFMGQFLTGPPDMDFFRKQAVEFGFDEEEYLRSLEEEIPVIPMEKARAHVSLLSQLAEMMGEMGLQQKKQLESEIQYRSIVENTGAAMVIYGEDGVILMCNSKFEELSACTKEEVEGKLHWYDFVPEDEFPRMMTYHKQRTKQPGKSPQKYDFRFCDKAGNLKPVHVVAALVPGTKRRVCSLLDITERKSTETELAKHRELLEALVRERTAELVKTNQRLEKEIAERELAERELVQKTSLLTGLIDSIPDMIFFKDMEGAYLGCNPKFEEFLGRSSGEIVGLTDYDLFPQEVADFFRKNDAAMMVQGRGRHNEEWIDYPDGRRILFDTLKAPLRRPDGEVVGLLGVSRDITIRKEIEAGIIKAKEAAESANRAKSEFLANMSHEIRTPMNAILGMGELLGEAELSREQREYVRSLNSSGEMLLSLINDILDFSKIEADQVALESIPFDMADLVENIGKILVGPAYEKGLRFSCSIASDIHPFRLGDPTRLRQILINLLGNAVKFTRKGEVVLEVVKDPDSKGLEMLNFVVRDTGIGIPPEKQETIFESFSQADMSTTRQFGGTGLGLTITRRLVNLMGGRIWCRSEVGVGTEFIFTAQLPRVGLPSVPTCRWAVPKGAIKDSDAVKQEGNSELPPLRILLVEDIDANRKVIKLFFKNMPVEIHMAENGKTAVDRFTRNHYDAVLMDLQMPVMDGYEATRAIRRWERENRAVLTPIIALTAHAFKEKEQACFDAGCTDFLSKPLRKRDLMEKLGSYVSGKMGCGHEMGFAGESVAPKNGSTDKKNRVRVDAELEELIPELFEEIRDALKKMEEALKGEDYDTLERLGHGFKGAVGSYGLEELAEIFLGVERGTKNGTPRLIAKQIRGVLDYIEQVEIEYVDKER